MLLVLDSCDRSCRSARRWSGCCCRTCPAAADPGDQPATARRVRRGRVRGGPAAGPDPAGCPPVRARSSTPPWPSSSRGPARCCPASALTTDNSEAVAGICHRLDGIPLAIELAAARLGTLGPQQALDQLDDRFARSGLDPDPSDRHRTLRACIDWSFDLCTEPEHRLWDRLSIFAEGSISTRSRASAPTTCCPGGPVGSRDGLTGKSILATERRRGPGALPDAGHHPRLRPRRAARALASEDAAVAAPP